MRVCLCKIMFTTTRIYPIEKHLYYFLRISKHNIETMKNDNFNRVKLLKLLSTLLNMVFVLTSDAVRMEKKSWKAIGI